MVQAQQPAALINQFGIGVHHAHRGRGGPKRGHLLRHPRGQQNVIGGKIKHKFAPAPKKSLVEGAAVAHVFGQQQQVPVGVPSGVFLQNGRAAVGTGIVHQPHVEVGIGLGDNRVQRLPHKRRVVVAQRYNAYAGRFAKWGMRKQE